MNLLRKLDNISRQIEKNMTTKQQVNTNVDNKRRDVADLRLLVTTHLLIIKNNTEITELKYLLMLEKKIRQAQQEIFYLLLKMGQKNFIDLINCIHKKAITRMQVSKVKDNLLFKTTRDLQNTRRVDTLKEEVRRDLDKISKKIIKDLQDVGEMKQVKSGEKDKMAGDNNVLLNEKDKLAEDKNVLVGDENNLAEEKNVLTSEKDKLAEEKNVLMKEKDNLAREKNAMAEEKAKLTEEKDKLTEEKAKLTDEKDKLTEEKAKLTEDKNVLLSEKDKLTEEKTKVTEEKDKLSEELNNLTEDKNVLLSENNNLAREKDELYVQNKELQIEIEKVHEKNKADLSRNELNAFELNATELNANELNAKELSVTELNKEVPGTVKSTADQDKKVINLNKKEVSVSNDKSKHKSPSKHKTADRDTPVLLHHKKNNSDAEGESLTESFIFVLSKGSIETDKRFVELIKQTLKDIERYSDPVIVRMGIQFILAKRYVDDIIYLKEHASRKKFLIM